LELDEKLILDFKFCNNKKLRIELIWSENSEKENRAYGEIFIGEIAANLK
jgi:hypothetical protein